MKNFNMGFSTQIPVFATIESLAAAWIETMNYSKEKMLYFGMYSITDYKSKQGTKI